MQTNLKALKQNLSLLANADKIEFLPQFFKTGEGEYAHGDKFIGVTVPSCHRIALQYKDLSAESVIELLQSPIHEERLVALFIWVEQFEKGEKETKDRIYKSYFDHIAYINNWDLVDASSYKIVGSYLLDKPHDALYNMVFSKNIWERRIAIVSTMAFIKKGEFADTFKLAEILLTDEQDLIQKAVGWLLREAGKKDVSALVDFLKKNYHNIPRTTLRYAIEKFDSETRKRYLKGEF